MLSREAKDSNVIVFNLTRSGLEPTIYRTRGEHANYYTTDAVPTTNTDENSGPDLIRSVTNFKIWWVEPVYGVSDPPPPSPVIIGSQTEVNAYTSHVH